MECPDPQKTISTLNTLIEALKDSAVKSYRLALADASLNASAKALVQTQHDAVLAAHNDIKKLRDDSTRAK